MDIPSTNTDARHEKLLCSTRMSRFMTFGQRWLKLSDSSSVGEQAPREREVHLAMDGECRGKHNLSKAKHLLTTEKDLLGLRSTDASCHLIVHFTSRHCSSSSNSNPQHI